MNTIIVYASMTGTTERMARTIANELMKEGDKVVIKDAIEAYAEELKSYDRLLMGSHTWGDGELSDEIIGFYEELIHTDLTGKLAAAFGPGDSTYAQFARAVDILEDSLKNQGCEIIAEGLKVDCWLEDDQSMEEKSISFARTVIQSSRLHSFA
ncbi:flavodoxin I [Cytobacillus eiseniae]|uniref:Flavodoxin n=1 Tax=Cytobacillus eiseniae TaxID=762947 RepID=A0ABS4RFT6_9BACI|nr:flavodoxin [Cytobacillus eiseniae]MBP2241767.1 flavodoxin I [Cytobacillus eiseniae]